MNLYEAIFVRKSVRSYRMEELDSTIINNLMIFAKHLSMLGEEYQIEYKIINNTNTEAIKGFGKGFNVKAPYYFIIASSKQNDYLLNAGFIMGQLSLYLASRGFGTCVLSSVKLNRDILDKSELEPVAVFAFGKAKETLYRDGRRVKRLKEEHTTTYKSEADPNIKTIVKAARYAPSRMNNQPWRFVIIDNRIHIFCRKDLVMERFVQRMKQIDIGIMLSFLFLAAEEQWIDINIKKLDNIADKSFRNNNYIISVMVK